MNALVPEDGRPGDALGGGLAAGGLSGSNGPEPLPVSVREDAATIRFDVTDVKDRE